jgi:4-diphosphocytidyl-2C-methyl-D-erythritol kinase
MSALSHPPAPDRLRLLAPAKINLHLRVGPPPTPGGFHPLLTWMCTVALFDTLTLSRAALPSAESSRGLLAGAISELNCDDPAVPCDATNLIVRAGTILADHIVNADRSAPYADAADRATREGGDAPVGSQVRTRANVVRGTEGTAAWLGLPRWKASLQKRIPTGAGLGGGSSDGARAMLGLERAWAAGLSRAQLAQLSARVGSDLPFFFFGSSSICTGRGEVVRPTPPPQAKWAVLVLPKIAMPTPAVYRKFDAMRLGDATSIAAEPAWEQWARLPAIDLLPKLVNDLETPAFSLRPDLASIREQVESQLRRPVRMSGSGSSLFTLYDDQAAAQNAATQLIAAECSVMEVEVAPAVHDDLGQ